MLDSGSDNEMILDKGEMNELNDIQNELLKQVSVLKEIVILKVNELQTLLNATLTADNASALLLSHSLSTDNWFWW